MKNTNEFTLSIFFYFTILSLLFKFTLKSNIFILEYSTRTELHSQKVKVHVSLLSFNIDSTLQRSSFTHTHMLILTHAIMSCVSYKLNLKKSGCRTTRMVE